MSPRESWRGRASRVATHPPATEFKQGSAEAGVEIQPSLTSNWGLVAAPANLHKQEA